MHLKFLASTRRLLVNGIALAVTVLLVLLVGPVRYSLNPDGGYLVAIVAQAPLIVAVIFQATFTPNIPGELRASRNLAMLRATYYLVTTLLFSAVLAIASTALAAGGAEEADPVGTARNLLAFTGAAFVGAATIGTSLGWLLPAAWAILPFVLITQSTARHEVLALAVQDGDSFTAFAFGVLVWLFGLWLVHGNRQGPFTIGGLFNRVVRKRVLRAAARQR